MKKILFFVMAAAMFCGCDKEENEGAPCPVTDVELPASSAKNPVQPGVSVTIQGNGFTETSQIWLRAETRAADVQAEVTGVNATEITFVAPEVSGVQTVVLKQDGDEWSLGKMHFAGTDNDWGIEILPKKLVKLISTADDGETLTQEYTYDDLNRLVKIESNDHGGVTVCTFAYDGNEIIRNYDEGTSTFILENEHVKKYTDVMSYETTSAAFSYDNGFMTGFDETFDVDGETDTYKGIITFQNGDITKYHIVDSYSLELVPDESVRNNLNLDMMGSYDFIAIDEESVTVSYLLGIAGIRSQHLPKKIKMTCDDEFYLNKYEYETEGEYLSKIKIYTSEGNSEEFPSTPTYTLRLLYE